MTEFAFTVLSSAGASAALILAFSWLLRAWIGERLSAGVRHEYDQRLSELNARLKQQGDLAATQLKAEMDRLAERLRHSAQSLGEMQKATLERKLSALDEVWGAVLAIEESLPPVSVYLDVLLDKEYASALTHPKISPLLKKIDHFAVINPVIERTKGVALKRPFVGSFLWALFSTYRASLFRIIYQVSQSQENPEKIHWYNDSLIKQHIKAGLGEHKLAEFDALRISRISWVRENFTRAILEAMDDIIAGRESSEAALRQAEKMETLLSESAGRHES